MADRVFDPAVIARACEPNPSPVVGTFTAIGIDYADTGQEVTVFADFTKHEDGSLTMTGFMYEPRAKAVPR